MQGGSGNSRPCARCRARGRARRLRRRRLARLDGQHGRRRVDRTGTTEAGGSSTGEPSAAGDDKGGSKGPTAPRRRPGSGSGRSAAPPSAPRAATTASRTSARKPTPASSKRRRSDRQRLPRARAKDDWAKSCAYLGARPRSKPLEELAARSPQLKGKGCAAILAALLGPVPASTPRQHRSTDGIASLRVEGRPRLRPLPRPNGVDYFMPMVKEGGEWKVAALAPTEFP